MLPGPSTPWDCSLSPPHHHPGTPPLTMTETRRTPRDWKRRGEPQQEPPTNRLPRSPREKRPSNPPAGLYVPLPGHVSGGRALDPAPAPAAPPPSCAGLGPLPGPTRRAERGGARGADWWVQKFKSNSSEGVIRTGKGRRSWDPAVCKWGGAENGVGDWEELEGGESLLSSVGCVCVGGRGGGRSGGQAYQA